MHVRMNFTKSSPITCYTRLNFILYYILSKSQTLSQKNDLEALVFIYASYPFTQLL
ncbi:hypothetical protein Bcop_1659 [Bacteroides coprosuis DSM 18011]|uniref:Uncharacterized protein n=1 Tax=Bacteroides coprosuis DSM 18011 TaxID=679937 RepID=F3ZQX8_9BACE|nr:hypothetical protein Bcop_1659 [Bacteroides coprosuis DSM 18011]